MIILFFLDLPVEPPCSNFALLNDLFQFLWSFNVNLNSKLRNIFMIILFFLDLPVEPPCSNFALLNNLFSISLVV